jgi:hypothetical protein
MGLIGLILTLTLTLRSLTLTQSHAYAHPLTLTLTPLCTLTFTLSHTSALILTIIYLLFFWSAWITRVSRPLALGTRDPRYTCVYARVSLPSVLSSSG